LVDAVSTGLIDVIVSGHNPQPAEEKRLPYEEAAFGAVGLETCSPAHSRCTTKATRRSARSSAR
jgi:dihydroorotase